MNFRSTVVALLLSIPSGAFVTAEPLPNDDLLTAMDQAGKDLALGKDRREIVDRLKQAIEQNSKSKFLGMAQGLRVDLSDSIQKAKTRSPGKNSLTETTLPLDYIWGSANWGKPLTRFVETHPDDPLSSILREDRRAIDSLLPLLRDRSPTRSYPGLRISGELPKVPRVCDMSLLTIEYFSKCRFHFNAFDKRLFHELSPEERDETIAHLENWWRENKAKSVADGIRAQLPYAEFYEKLEMADNLARLGGETPDNPDRADGINVLRTLARENWGPKAARAADLLARLGDLSPVDDFYARWQESIHDPAIYSSHIAFYLLDHGTRREWEFLYALAENEIVRPDERYEGVRHLLVNCRKARTSPLAIPGLGLALTQTEMFIGKVKVTPPPEYSYADKAAESLQKLTGIDFGYRKDDSAENRSVAIEKARQWWETEGSRKYTFDYIETLLETGDHKSKNDDKP